jgi:hypothetical protein
MYIKSMKKGSIVAITLVKSSSMYDATLNGTADNAIVALVMFVDSRRTSLAIQF